MTVNYARAPVVEVSLSVQFDSIPGFLAPHTGAIWDSFRDEFPLIEQHPPLAPTIEQPSQPTLIPQSAIVSGPRVWMVKEDRTELIQIQQNRFVRNWRNYDDASGNLPYPNYEPELKARFDEDFTKFCEKLGALNLQSPVINQCDFGYINWIRRENVWESHNELHKVLRHYQDTSANLDGKLETTSVQMTKKIIQQTGEFFGRLYFAITPITVRSLDQKGTEPAFQASINVRGNPHATNQSYLEFFDIAHTNAISVFENSFSCELQQAWGRKE